MLTSLKKYFGLDTKTIGRKRYFIANLSLNIIVIIWATIFYSFIALFSDYNLIIVTMAIITFLVGIIAIFITVETTISRIMDIGWKSKRWALILLIPYINLIFMFYLCLKKSKVNL